MCSTMFACKVRKQRVNFYQLKRCGLTAGLPVASLSSCDTLLSLSPAPPPLRAQLMFLVWQQPRKTQPTGLPSHR